MRTYEEYRETKCHGDAVFPFNIYPCVIPDMFSEVLTHWHEEMEIIYIRSGTGLVTVDFDSRVCRGPALVFVLPGQTHAICRIEGETMTYENILFHPRLLYSMNGEVFDLEYLKPLFGGQIRIPTFLRQGDPGFGELEETVSALNGLCRGGPAYPLFAKSRLYELCFYLVKDYPRIEETPARGDWLERMKVILSYVEAHYPEELRVAEVAALIGFSESHFMRCFKEWMGLSFITYLKEYRLSRAEGLLRTTTSSILEVAQETGFRNFSYFIRNFKEKYGTTPRKYRSAWNSGREGNQ